MGRPRRLGPKTRTRLIDPILVEAGSETKRLVVALSDDFHLLPLDALPLDDGRRLGDEIAIDVVDGLDWLTIPPLGELNAPRFVAAGDIDFLGKPRSGRRS